jgi:hypothetical protein
MAVFIIVIVIIIVRAQHTHSPARPYRVKHQDRQMEKPLNLLVDILSHSLYFSTNVEQGTCNWPGYDEGLGEGGTDVFECRKVQGEI